MATIALDEEQATDEGPPIPWRSVVACLAAALLGLGLGVFLRRDDPPSASSVDVRFLQDMRYHHEQAVGMSLVLLGKTTAGANITVRSIAREIVQSQAFEGGRMAQMLTQFRAAVANEGDSGMEWMGMAAPLNEMPGMATEDETTELDADQGPAADKLFVRLMIAHHQGGIHMAEYAAAHAGTQTVRAFTYSVVAGQQSEINELQALAAKL